MLKLSTSFIQDFKACPQRCYFNRILRVRPIEETESLRMGTHWHKLLELWDIDKVTEYLNKAYEECPVSKTIEEWETERIMLLYSFIGYKWHWGEEQEPKRYVESEKHFEIPLISPTTGYKLQAVLVGKIDKIIKSCRGPLYYLIREQKSTGSSLDSDSTFWNRLAMDTQTTLYPYALRQMGYSNVVVEYDVWHKPQIRPKKLTQADSKKFVADGMYCGEKFAISRCRDFGYAIGRKPVEWEPGAKEGTFAIRETPEMFGARLLQDITERPEFYFARKEIARTDRDYERFEKQLFNIYHTIRLMKKNNGWYCDESQCEATFHCSYIPICYNDIEVDVKNPPEGFEVK